MSAQRRQTGSDSQRTTPSIELLYALEQDGCPVCMYVDRMLEYEWFWLAHENVSSLEFRRKTVASLGLCAAHSRRFREAIEESRRQLSASDVLSFVTKRLAGYCEAVARSARSGGPVPALEHTGCPICEIAARSASAAISEIVDGFSEIEGRFASGPGLCADHLLEMVRVSDAEKLGRILELERGKLLALTRDLEIYGYNSDYRRHHLWTEEQLDAWLRTLAKLTGNAAGLGSRPSVPSAPSAPARRGWRKRATW